VSRDGVLTLISRLHSHQDLVSAAYHEGEVVRNDDNRRGIEYLQQHKVLIPRTQDTLTLHTTFRRFLDASLNIERLYRVGADVGAAFEQLEQLAESLFVATHEGRAEDRERFEDEVLQSIYEIADNLAADLAHLRALVENRFATVSTLAEKQRQNAYYIGRTEKLVQAIEAFTLSDLGERMQSQSPFAGVLVMFQSQLLDRLPSFRQNLLDILAILQTYLFEFRSIEARTRRVRGLWLFLERHPLFEPAAWDERPTVPTWLMRAPGITVTASPTVRDPEYTDALALLAQEITPLAHRLPVARLRGTLTIEDEATVELAPRLYQAAIQALMAACRHDGQSRSALAWHAQHPELIAAITAPLWLQCMLEEIYQPKALEQGLRHRIDATSPVPFDGNLQVRDVVVEMHRES